MQATQPVKTTFRWALFIAAVLSFGALQAKNEVLGEIHFDAKNRAAKSSGVWVDGQYVGYLKELKGSKKILLLPGKHRIEVRQAGYLTVSGEVVVEPGKKKTVKVKMQKDPSAQYGTQTALVKITGEPERAAVMVDNQFVGYVDQFNGPGQGMLLTPGRHAIQVSLPGYQTFETEVTLRPHQKLTLETDLLKADAPERKPRR